MPKCYGRYSEDSRGRTSVECDYCPVYHKCYAESIKETSACGSCKNPDECNIGCYTWMVHGEPEEY